MMFCCDPSFVVVPTRFPMSVFNTIEQQRDVVTLSAMTPTLWLTANHRSHRGGLVVVANGEEVARVVQGRRVATIGRRARGEGTPCQPTHRPQPTSERPDM
ncbi:unnamed protein product [Angiostrongylus costaricensis]|uniref:CN hydrolase domain-containing protein n=1 Tax=Angiostrongylus costaricensis TaxID=334426 RepID=A0A0R3PVD3_ANGCS|nr:unnamed protein product [Angiostrongylus costaricensis]